MTDKNNGFAAMLPDQASNAVIGGLVGLLVGDALGVPYEFHSPDLLPTRKEIEMESPAGFLRAHSGVGAGAWSDDAATAQAEADKTSDQVVAQQQAVTVPNPVQQPAVQEPPAPAPVMPAPEAKEAPATAVTALVAPEKTSIEASFDCGKAASKIEKLICSTPETAAADKRLAAAYGAARAKSSDINALKAQQVEWMKQERNACTDSACLLKVTEGRIQKLSVL